MISKASVSDLKLPLHFDGVTRELGTTVERTQGKTSKTMRSLFFSMAGVEEDAVGKLFSSGFDIPDSFIQNFYNVSRSDRC